MGGKIIRKFTDSEIGANNVFISETTLYLNNIIKKNINFYNYPQTKTLYSIFYNYLKKYNFSKENFVLGAGSVEIIKNLLYFFKIKNIKKVDSYAMYQVFDSNLNYNSRVVKSFIIYPDVNKKNKNDIKEYFIKIIKNYDIIDIAYLFNYLKIEEVFNLIYKYQLNKIFIFSFSKLLGLPNIRLGIAIGDKKHIKIIKSISLPHGSILDPKSFEFIIRDLEYFHENHIKSLKELKKYLIKKLNKYQNNLLFYNNFNVFLDKKILPAKQLNNSIFRHSINIIQKDLYEKI